jgi:hypothetical protein
MHNFPEIEIDLTAQELTDPQPVAPIEVDVDDICQFDPLLSPSQAANTDVAPSSDPFTDDDTIEIELNDLQIDALLSGRTIR